MRDTLALGALAFFTACVSHDPATKIEEREPPNVVIVYVDDLGFGDLGCYGHPTIRTPHLDRMAAEGVKLTQFYSAGTVCSPSRAALLTGCYPTRVGMENHVLFPDSVTGLHPDERTLAEALREVGYRTACIGKWHLGHHEKFLPLQQGFDEYFGIPYSNDMSRKEQVATGNTKYPHELPWFRGNEIIELEPDQRRFTREFTEEAVRFIEENAEERFFLYMPQPMPHIPLHPGVEFAGTSLRGKYGDVLEELDWSVGQVLETLERAGIADNTLVIFSSDNGPWLPFEQDGGSAGLLSGGKGSTLEGGLRVPCIARWPEAIPGGRTSAELLTTMDLFASVALFCGNEPVTERAIDGLDARDVFTDPAAKSPRETFYYFDKNGPMRAVRRGKWKFHRKRETLHDLHTDPGEKHNRIEAEPRIAAELDELMTAFEEELATAARPIGRLE